MAEKVEGAAHHGGGLVDPSNYPVAIETIYVSNLEERVKIPHLKDCLTIVFRRFGTIIDIIAKTSLKRKGQAFIVFDSEKSSLESIELMNGFTMFDKPIKVRRAKTHSDETVKRKAPELFEEHKRKRLMAKDFKRAEEEAKAQANPDVVEKPRAPKTGLAAVPDQYLAPNKELALKDLPADVTEDDLTTLFERFEGFKEIRLVRFRNFAIAEFENEQFAIAAKEATANTPIGAKGSPLNVSYQRP
ncbi:hypothetical protein IQ07DRAFT_266827 [Pyrenochaeta sp. DS3sAY3a]|nr:hypothetical protein IQ07DRAFT_266827 [Pyrenochaeta sp. DS3sAY3a]